MYYNDSIMTNNFTHLHTHSHYSLLSALPKIDELVATAKNMGMNALAITDNGNLYGAIEFYKACKKAGIKPIIGLDAYVAYRTRRDKQGSIDNRRTRLILLAKNNAGYKNLMRLVTDSNIEGFYYKPRIDKETMKRFAEGLIAIMPAWHGDISSALSNVDEKKATELATLYKEIYPDRLFLQITHHPEIDRHENTMKKIAAFGKKMSIPLVAGHEVYYIKPEEARARNTLLAIQNSGADLNDNRTGENVNLSFISPADIFSYFSSEPEVLSREPFRIRQLHLFHPG